MSSQNKSESTYQEQKEEAEIIMECYEAMKKRVAIRTNYQLLFMELEGKIEKLSQKTSQRNLDKK
ncbi:hypothetical protein LCGC14_1588940 [marine sediment metagenome]|uniref:Uncharacterized protein n=1 Tax=marine sediment metagenome TaxID=412755 RepID=A0A0F9J0W2_9ZZZZ